MKSTKISIIGTGNVGATTAYTLILKNLGSEIILVDRNEEKCDGEVRDLSDAIPFSEVSHVRQGTLKEAGQAEIIIITAGVGKIEKGQTRLDLININKEILKDIIEGMKPLNKNAIIIMVANPVDILTCIAQEISGLPRKQVMGSGTLLDTQRLRGYLSEKLDISEYSIHAYVLGEHGNSQFVAWTHSNVAGIPLNKFCEITGKCMKDIAEDTMKEAYKIIEEKGATYYGIAACVSEICENIIYDQKRVMPVSSYQEKFGICFSMPTVLGCDGVKEVLDIELSDDEKNALEKSAKQLKSVM